MAFIFPDQPVLIMDQSISVDTHTVNVFVACVYADDKYPILKS